MALIRGLFFFSLLSAVIEACLAAPFMVGGTGSWNLGNNYQSWADGTTFHVGDTLAFSYSGSMHSVVETDSAGYQSCAPSNALFQDNAGNTVVTLMTPGTHYFICGTPGHCSGGMKFSVSVLDSSTTSTSPAIPTTTSTPTTYTISAATVASPTTLLFTAGTMSIGSLFLFFL